MQHEGLQYGQGATANSHHILPFPHTDAPQQHSTGGTSTTTTLRQFRKKDNVDKHSTTTDPRNTTSEDNPSHIARVAPHNHYPLRQNDYFNYPQQQYAPEFALPCKESTQGKYSEISDPHPIQHIDHLGISKHKEKEFMEMCNIPQQTQMRHSYPEHMNRQQSYPYDQNIHHSQYLHKEPQIHPGYKQESQYLMKDIQYQQYPVPKYNMPPQGRKYSPPASDFLSQLQRIHPSMARSIMNDQHLRESQSSYTTTDQNRIYSQSQRYFPSSVQNNPQTYHNYVHQNVPQPHGYPPSCSYKHSEYTRTSQINPIPRYSSMNHMECNVSPRRNYPENLSMGINYPSPPQKISPTYPQYSAPEYAQHYQYRRPSVPPSKEYYTQAYRPEYMQSHQMSREIQENRSVTVSNSIKQYLENWAEEDNPPDIPTLENSNKYPVYKESIRVREDNHPEPVYVINSADLPQCLETGIPVLTENGQYILKSSIVDNSTGMIRIIESSKDQTSLDTSNNIVNLHIVEENSPDCMMSARPIGLQTEREIENAAKVQTSHFTIQEQVNSIGCHNEYSIDGKNTEPRRPIIHANIQIKSPYENAPSLQRNIENSRGSEYKNQNDERVLDLASTRGTEHHVLYNPESKASLRNNGEVDLKVQGSLTSHEPSVDGEAITKKDCDKYVNHHLEGTLLHIKHVVKTMEDDLQSPKPEPSPPTPCLLTPIENCDINSADEITRKDIITESKQESLAECKSLVSKESSVDDQPENIHRSFEQEPCRDENDTGFSKQHFEEEDLNETRALDNTDKREKEFDNTSSTESKEQDLEQENVEETVNEEKQEVDNPQNITPIETEILQSVSLQKNCADTDGLTQCVETKSEFISLEKSTVRCETDPHEITCIIDSIKLEPEIKHANSPSYILDEDETSAEAMHSNNKEVEQSQPIDIITPTETREINNFSPELLVPSKSCETSINDSENYDQYLENQSEPSNQITKIILQTNHSQNENNEEIDTELENTYSTEIKSSQENVSLYPKSEIHNFEIQPINREEKNIKLHTEDDFKIQINALDKSVPKRPKSKSPIAKNIHSIQSQQENNDKIDTDTENKQNIEKNTFEESLSHHFDDTGFVEDKNCSSKLVEDSKKENRENMDIASNCEVLITNDKNMPVGSSFHMSSIKPEVDKTISANSTCSNSEMDKEQYKENDKRTSNKKFKSYQDKEHAKKRKRIFSVDDIINKIGTKSKETRRLSLQHVNIVGDGDDIRNNRELFLSQNLNKECTKDENEYDMSESIREHTVGLITNTGNDSIHFSVLDMKQTVNEEPVKTSCDMGEDFVANNESLEENSSNGRIALKDSQFNFNLRNDKIINFMNHTIESSLTFEVKKENEIENGNELTDTSIHFGEGNKAELQNIDHSIIEPLCSQVLETETDMNNSVTCVSVKPIDDLVLAECVDEPGNTDEMDISGDSLGVAVSIDEHSCLESETNELMETIDDQTTAENEESKQINESFKSKPCNEDVPPVSEDESVDVHISENQDKAQSDQHEDGLLDDIYSEEVVSSETQDTSVTENDMSSNCENDNESDDTSKIEPGLNISLPSVTSKNECLVETKVIKNHVEENDSLIDDPLLITEEDNVSARLSHKTLISNCNHNVSTDEVSIATSADEIHQNQTPEDEKDTKFPENTADTIPTNCREEDDEINQETIRSEVVLSNSNTQSQIPETNTVVVINDDCQKMITILEDPEQVETPDQPEEHYCAPETAVCGTDISDINTPLALSIEKNPQQIVQINNDNVLHCSVDKMTETEKPEPENENTKSQKVDDGNMKSDETMKNENLSKENYESELRDKNEELMDANTDTNFNNGKKEFDEEIPISDSKEPDEEMQDYSSQEFDVSQNVDIIQGVDDETEYRNVLKIEDNEVLLEIGGELMEITVNFVNGRKIISVSPFSQAATVNYLSDNFLDINDNYQTLNSKPGEIANEVNLTVSDTASADTQKEDNQFELCSNRENVNTELNSINDGFELYDCDISVDHEIITETEPLRNNIIEEKEKIICEESQICALIKQTVDHTNEQTKDSMDEFEINKDIKSRYSKVYTNTKKASKLVERKSYDFINSSYGMTNTSNNAESITRQNSESANTKKQEYKDIRQSTLCTKAAKKLYASDVQYATTCSDIKANQCSPKGVNEKTSKRKIFKSKQSNKVHVTKKTNPSDKNEKLITTKGEAIKTVPEKRYLDKKDVKAKIGLNSLHSQQQANETELVKANSARKYIHDSKVKQKEALRKLIEMRKLKKRKKSQERPQTPNTSDVAQNSEEINLTRVNSVMELKDCQVCIVKEVSIGNSIHKSILNKSEFISSKYKSAKNKSSPVKRVSFSSDDPEIFYSHDESQDLKKDLELDYDLPSKRIMIDSSHENIAKRKLTLQEYIKKRQQPVALSNQNIKFDYTSDESKVTSSTDVCSTWSKNPEKNINEDECRTNMSDDISLSDEPKDNFRKRKLSIIDVWENSPNSASSPTQSTCNENDSQFNVVNSQVKKFKHIIDMSEFDVKRGSAEASTPTSSLMNSSPEKNILQVYKDEIDLKLNSLNLQIPISKQQKPNEDSDSKNTMQLGSFSLAQKEMNESNNLMRKFLNREKLSSEEIAKVRRIISYKRLIEMMHKVRNKPANFNPELRKDNSNRDSKQIKLHYEKITEVPKKKRKRFRNLYAADSSDAESSDSSENLKGVGDYSVYQKNSSGVPKLIFKRTITTDLQPVVKLERSYYLDLLAKKKKYC